MNHGGNHDRCFRRRHATRWDSLDRARKLVRARSSASWRVARAGVAAAAAAPRVGGRWGLRVGGSAMRCEGAGDGGATDGATDEYFGGALCECAWVFGRESHSRRSVSSMDSRRALDPGFRRRGTNRHATPASCSLSTPAPIDGRNNRHAPHLIISQLSASVSTNPSSDASCFCCQRAQLVRVPTHDRPFHLQSPRSPNLATGLPHCILTYRSLRFPIPH